MGTVKLSSPIQNGEQEITELNFRELTVGDLVAADAVEGDLGRIAAALALSADVPLPVFKTIKAKDLKAIMDANPDIVGN